MSICNLEEEIQESIKKRKLSIDKVYFNKGL